MKDIDFDELDKAVNSLMGGVKVKSDRPEAKTLTLTTTLKDGEQPEYDKIQHAAEKIGSETLLGPMEKTAILSGTADEQVNVISLSDKPLEPLTLEEVTAAPLELPTAPTVAAIPETPPQQALSKAQSGRFMDVMHPSSDMKTAQVKTPSAAKAAQTAKPAIVVPSRPVATSEVKPTPQLELPTELVQAPVEVATPVPETLPVAVPEDRPQHSEGVAETISTVPELDSPVENPIEPVTKSEPVVPPQPVLRPTQDSQEQIEPLTSPFLPDAKVEKRPLGGAADTGAAGEVDLSSLDAPYANDNSADTQLTPTEADQVTLPDELHTDLLAIETNFAEAAESQEKPETIPVLESKHTPIVDNAESPSPVSVAETADTPENGAIFDTTDYHKTVSHPAKHTSEWIWIAVIVGIIVVCAAGAAAFYLLGSQ